MSYRKKKGFDKSVYRSFAMVMQFGINMLVPICVMSALGIFIDKKLGTNFVMIILFFVGAFAGARNVYRMAKFSMDDHKGESGEKTDGGHSGMQTDKGEDISATVEKEKKYGDISASEKNK